MSDQSDETKLALKIQSLERDIREINAWRDKADGRWSAVYDMAKKIGLIVSLFLLSFWARAKDLI